MFRIPRATKVVAGLTVAVIMATVLPAYAESQQNSGTASRAVKGGSYSGSGSVDGYACNNLGQLIRNNVSPAILQTTGTWQGCIGDKVKVRAYCGTGALIYRFYGTRQTDPRGKNYVRGYTVSRVSWPWCEELVTDKPRPSFGMYSPSRLDSGDVGYMTAADAKGAEIRAVGNTGIGHDPKALPWTKDAFGRYGTSSVDRMVGMRCTDLMAPVNATIEFLKTASPAKIAEFGRLSELEAATRMRSVPLAAQLQFYNLKYSLAGSVTKLTAAVFTNPNNYQPAGAGQLCDSVYDFAVKDYVETRQPVAIGACYVALDARGYVGDSTMSFRTEDGSRTGGIDAARHISPSGGPTLSTARLGTPLVESVRPDGSIPETTRQLRAYQNAIVNDLKTYNTYDLRQALKRSELPLKPTIDKRTGEPYPDWLEPKQKATEEDVNIGPQDDTLNKDQMAMQASRWANCYNYAVKPWSGDVFAPPINDNPPPAPTNDVFNPTPWNPPATCAGPCPGGYATIDISITVPGAFNASGAMNPGIVRGSTSNVSCPTCISGWYMAGQNWTIRATGEKGWDDYGTSVSDVRWNSGYGAVEKVFTGNFYNATPAGIRIQVAPTASGIIAKNYTYHWEQQSCSGPGCPGSEYKDFGTDWSGTTCPNGGTMHNGQCLGWTTSTRNVLVRDPTPSGWSTNDGAGRWERGITYRTTFYDLSGRVIQYGGAALLPVVGALPRAN